ncbi:MAG: DUF1972 domain-containing protein [Saprospiraceae bacterium]
MTSPTNLSKLSIIGTVGVPARYGGFETLVHYLVPHLRERFDMTIYCSGKAYPKNEQKETWQGANLHYIPLEANGLQSVLYDIWSMIHALKHSDVLLILGVSGCIFLPFIKLFFNKKVIVNIDGLEWRRPKWGKLAKAFLLWSEKMACRYADEVVTDNRILKEYVKIRYGIEGQLIEYGADHVQAEDYNWEDVKQYPFLHQNYAFKVARIEPENNLHTILAAFAQLPHLPLVIVGNWDNSQYGKRLRKTYAQHRHIYLLDPIYDLQQLNLLRSNAYVYVHGHSAGGTNPSLVEAMYLELPIIAFDVIYNRVTTNNQSLFFTDTADLKTKIERIAEQPLQDIARQLKKYADRRYTWKTIAERYGDVASGKKEVWIPNEVALAV